MRARFLVLAALAACQRQDPEPAPKPANDCAVVVARVRAAVQSQLESVGSDARSLIIQMLPAMEDACVQDHWPAPLVHCIVAAKPGDLAAMTRCNALMPKDLQDKLQKRMMQLRPATTP